MNCPEQILAFEYIQSGPRAPDVGRETALRSGSRAQEGTPFEKIVDDAVSEHHSADDWGSPLEQHDIWR